MGVADGAEDGEGAGAEVEGEFPGKDGEAGHRAVRRMVRASAASDMDELIDDIEGSDFVALCEGGVVEDGVDEVVDGAFE